MPIYTSSLATAGVVTGNAANTESPGTWSLKTASQGRNIYFQAMYVIGRASALTSISGMAFRILSFTTASTAGTAFTPTSKDVTANETATASRSSRSCRNWTRNTASSANWNEKGCSVDE